MYIIIYTFRGLKLPVNRNIYIKSPWFTGNIGKLPGGSIYSIIGFWDLQYGYLTLTEIIADFENVHFLFFLFFKYIFSMYRFF